MQVPWDTYDCLGGAYDQYTRMQTRKRKYPGVSKRAPAGKKARYAVVSPPNNYRIVRNPRMEYKVWDWDKISQTASTTIGIFNLLSAGTTTPGLTRGTSSKNNFLGNIIDIVSIDFSYEIVGSTAVAPDVYNTTRLMLFQWNDDAVPSAVTIFENIGTIQAPMSPVFFDNRDDINVLADIRQVSSPIAYDPTVGAVVGYSGVYNGRRFIKAKNGRKIGPCSFLSAAVTYQKGGIFCALLSDSIAAPHPTVNIYCRITFVE